MSERGKTGIGPCDKCGSDDDCRCGECQCKWCRIERGEAVTELEAATIKKHMADLRGDDVRQSADRMRENIRREASHE